MTAVRLMRGGAHAERDRTSRRDGSPSGAGHDPQRPVAGVERTVRRPRDAGGSAERCEQQRGSIRTGPPSDQTVVPRKCLPDGRPIAAAERGAPDTGSSADTTSSRRRLAADAARHPADLPPARSRRRASSCSPTRACRSCSASARSSGRRRPCRCCRPSTRGSMGAASPARRVGCCCGSPSGSSARCGCCRSREASAVWTFHFPFIAAAMVLGGPTAGAWVAFLATLERRELESQPWYGTLANHSVMAFGAVVGGLSVLVVRGALASANVDPGTAGVIAIAVGTLVLAVTANGMAAGTIMLRERLAAMAMFDILVRSFGRVTLAEIGLASMFTVAYVAVGWWAPAALAIVVLLVWPGEGFDGHRPDDAAAAQPASSSASSTRRRSERRGMATGGPAADARSRPLRRDQQERRTRTRRRGPRGGRRPTARHRPDDGSRRPARRGRDRDVLHRDRSRDDRGRPRPAHRVESADLSRPSTATGAGRGVDRRRSSSVHHGTCPLGPCSCTGPIARCRPRSEPRRPGARRSGIRFHPYGRHRTAVRRRDRTSGDVRWWRGRP